MCCVRTALFAKVVEIDIPAEPSKLAVPVTAPETAIALAVVSVAAEPVVSWLSVPTTKSIVPSPSSYVAEIPVSVFELNIAPTRS